MGEGKGFGGLMKGGGRRENRRFEEEKKKRAWERVIVASAAVRRGNVSKGGRKLPVPSPSSNSLVFPLLLGANFA
jgi:hypothetical protein